jgi:type IV secretory pathway TrbD component
MMFQKPETLVGVALLAGMLTGLAGLVVATIAFVNTEWTASSLGLIASALAFGLVANAALRR